MSRRPTPVASPYESGVWGTPEKPCPSERTLAAHLDGELDAARARAVDAHLDLCMACASDSQRLENLSGCLQSWSRSRAAVDPSPRLLGRVLREVSAEGSARLREVSWARRRLALAAAAALVMLGLGAALGLATRDDGAAGSPAAWRPTALAVDRAAREPLSVPALVVAPAAPRGGGDEDAAQAAAIAARWAKEPVLDRALLADASTVEAVARWLPALGAQQRMGERVCVLDGRALPAWAIPEYEHVRLWARSIAERQRLVDEPGTRDPADAGLALSELMELPADASAGWAMLSPDAVVVPASPQGGGLVLRALPRSAASASAAATAESLPPPPPPPSHDPMRDPFDRDPPDDPPAPAPRAARAAPASPIDLATAVRTGRAKLLPDVSLDRSDVGLEVAASDAPILVPAGELLRGGAGDRVFADGTWLAGTGSAYVVRLATRPVDRHTGRLGGAPEVVGAVAGPELRALLARGEDSAAVLALVHAQLRDAGLLGPEGAEAGEPSLLALYALEPAATLAQAKRLVHDLGDDVTGFVAADPSGRFQGLERVDVPGEAGRAVLARLVAGYLAEARVRSASDGARTGVQTTDVLGALSKHPPRLAPSAGAASRASSVAGVGGDRPAPSLHGIEPRTGLLLQGVRSSNRAVPLLSGLVRDFVK